MLSSLSGVEARYADAIAAAVGTELQLSKIDDSRVELTGGKEPDTAVLSVGVIVEGVSSAPLLVETGNFDTSLAAQMDLLRAWLRAGHPPQVIVIPGVQYKAGQRVPVPDATEPVVAARDSKDNRVWVVSERVAKDASPEAIPYLIYPDGSLVKEQQHGLPD